MKKWFNLILAAGFGMVLALPTVGLFGPAAGDQAINENRPKAQFPQFPQSLLGCKYFFRLLENFYDDRFGFREPLIAFDLRVKRTLFPAELSRVASPLQGMPGQDGWMYLEQDGNVDLVDDYQGLSRFTPIQLYAAQARLAAERDWLATLGIKYLLVIAPDKESVYPEHLPVWLKPGAGTKLDQFLEYMHLHSTVEVLDLRPALRRAGKTTPVYYQTDTHWNVMGAYVASETIITELAAQMPGLTPIGPEAFTRQQLKSRGGDLAVWAGNPDMVENNRLFLIPGTNLPTLEFSSPQTNQVGLPQIWSLPISGLYTLVTTNGQGSREAMIYGDSFAVALQPFLGFHFGKVVGMWKPFDLSCGTEPRPDVVIEEVVERHLDHLMEMR